MICDLLKLIKWIINWLKNYRLSELISESIVNEYVFFNK